MWWAADSGPIGVKPFERLSGRGLRVYPSPQDLRVDLFELVARLSDQQNERANRYLTSVCSGPQCGLGRHPIRLAHLPRLLFQN